jgi:hypothetical protein
LPKKRKKIRGKKRKRRTKNAPKSASRCFPKKGNEVKAKGEGNPFGLALGNSVDIAV